MKRIITFIMVGLLALPFSHADEGMWLPLLLQRLNYVDMQKEGLRLTPEEIYSINHSSLKDAIIQFGGGCTGEIISDKGLILTNHHCGYGQIQAHSTVEHDYLSNGFWAYTMEDELPNPGLTAKFLVRMEDVTAAMLEGIDYKMDEKVRNDSLMARSKRLVGQATEGNHYEAEVKDFSMEMNTTCSFTKPIKMSDWLVPHLHPSGNTVPIPTTGCGQGIRAISRCSGFIWPPTEHLRHIQKKMCL